ncbi:DNA adenine methylase [Rhodobacter ferrooxidans]|uniref:Site-specific DNA-methyltransferase (adenine-specific) n=1 Tax=Rhodobacter ferrooxidans TaxID=371731 RepID=C8S5J4_9RHOB|nr:DNA adenine methylase [Rhodobacter sp. SW2]EEW23762.1 DNA adenine methylase [Rhodobacter sp. SW2]
MKSFDAFLFEPAELPTFEVAKESHTSHGDVPSLLKWTGSKRSQAARIAAFAPSHERYYEPFIGGGALLFMLGKPGAVGADIYAPLIAFWKLVRDDAERLIDDYTTQWAALQADLPGYFYIVRDRFNADQRPEDLNFLMRTCVNGIVRFSKSGQFNNSFHLSRKGMLPQRFAKIVREWSAHLQGIEFRNGDFQQTTADAQSGDFVYLDPPYAGNKQRYIGDLDVDRFYSVLDELNRRSVKWALSFDGTRGETAYDYSLPAELYKRKELLKSGYSAVAKVLNGPVEMVTESLYLNY